MRVYIHIPDCYLSVLQEQARAAHRPPRYHLEWLIEQALQGKAPDQHQKACNDMTFEEAPAHKVGV